MALKFDRSRFKNEIETLPNNKVASDQKISDAPKLGLTTPGQALVSK